MNVVRMYCPRCSAVQFFPAMLLHAFSAMPCSGWCNVCAAWLRTDGVRLVEVSNASVPADIMAASKPARMFEDPLGFAKAVEVDNALRIPGNIINRNMDQPMFLHRSCKPLALVQFDTTPNAAKAAKAAQGQLFRSNFAAECLGVCGV